MIRFGRGDQMAQKQRNMSSRTAKLVTPWLSENEIPVLDWPANSPDLNVLGDAGWGMCQKRVDDANPKTEVRLKMEILDVANALELSEIRRSIDNSCSMRYVRRLALRTQDGKEMSGVA